jgi:hypothetical protein
LSGLTGGGGFSGLGVTALATGLTEFGFEVPAGDPGGVSDAARALAKLGAALSEHAHHVSRAESQARGDECWAGEAANAYGAYSGRLAHGASANGSALQSAASALRGFAHDLEHAQKITRAALADCVRLQQQMSVQRGLAAAAAQTSLAATNQAISAPHPALASDYQRQAAEALRRQITAHAAADAAETELEAAKRRGRHASEAYTHAADAIGRQLHAVGGELHRAPKLSGRPPVPVSVTPEDVQLANALMHAAEVLGPEDLDPFEGTQLERLLGRRLTPGAIQQLTEDLREKQAEEGPRPWGSMADRFGGEIHGLVGIHVFGNRETGGYRTGDRLGGIATDVTLGTTCVIASGGMCAAAGGGLFASRSGGVYQEHSDDVGEMAKAELFNVVKTGLSTAPGGSLGMLPGVAKAIQTSGPLAARVAAGQATAKVVADGLKSQMITIGSHRISLEIPIKAKLELTGAALSQLLEEAKIHMERE